MFPKVFELFKFNCICITLTESKLHGAKADSAYGLSDPGVICMFQDGGWSGGATVLIKLPVPGRPTIRITVGQGPTALAVGAGGGCLDIFTQVYPFTPLFPSLWETARYRLKYCLKGPLNPIQPTNQKCFKMNAATLSGEATRLFASFSFAGQLLKEIAVFASSRANLFLKVALFFEEWECHGK